MSKFETTLSDFGTDELINELVLRGYIHAFWQEDDIEHQLIEDEGSYDPEDIPKIAKYVSDNWDASIGISWDSLSIMIQLYYQSIKTK